MPALNPVQHLCSMLQANAATRQALSPSQSVFSLASTQVVGSSQATAVPGGDDDMEGLGDAIFPMERQFGSH